MHQIDPEALELEVELPRSRALDRLPGVDHRHDERQLLIEVQPPDQVVLGQLADPVVLADRDHGVVRQAIDAVVGDRLDRGERMQYRRPEVSDHVDRRRRVEWPKRVVVPALEVANDPTPLRDRRIAETLRLDKGERHRLRGVPLELAAIVHRHWRDQHRPVSRG
jgi:hypothetical protein